MRRLLRSVPAMSVVWVGAAAVTLACAKPAPEPPPGPEPIHLGSGGSPSIEFEHVVIQIPTGQVIGHAYRWGRELSEIRFTSSAGRSEEFNVAATSELQKAGYPVYELADRMFAGESAKAARLRLGGVVGDLELNRYFTRSRQMKGRAEARMPVEFRLFDARNGEVVFQGTYTGEARDEGANPNALTPAFVDALRRLLADPSFVERVRAIGGDTPAAAGGNEPIQIARCRRGAPAPLPAGMDRPMSSFVRVLVGGTSGSGVIVSPNGHVLTAAHVVQGEDAVTIQMSSGLRLSAARLRADVGQDVALLKVKGSGFPCAPRHNGSELPPVGADVYALGTPIDPRLDRSVSKGVVSGYREIEGFRFIQTDTSLNPGHSGGPLFDERGRLVGIVSFKVVDVGVEGIGFGVPLDVIEDRLRITWQSPSDPE